MDVTLLNHQGIAENVHEIFLMTLKKQLERLKIQRRNEDCASGLHKTAR